jgi:hypothetical protein
VGRVAEWLTSLLERQPALARGVAYTAAALQMAAFVVAAKQQAMALATSLLGPATLRVWFGRPSEYALLHIDLFAAASLASTLALVVAAPVGAAIDAGFAGPARDTLHRAALFFLPATAPASLAHALALRLAAYACMAAARWLLLWLAAFTFVGFAYDAARLVLSLPLNMALWDAAYATASLARGGDAAVAPPTPFSAALRRGLEAAALSYSVFSIVGSLAILSRVHRSRATAAAFALCAAWACAEAVWSCMAAFTPAEAARGETWAIIFAFILFLISLSAARFAYHVDAAAAAIEAAGAARAAELELELEFEAMAMANADGAGPEGAPR